MSPKRTASSHLSAPAAKKHASAAYPPPYTPLNYPVIPGNVQHDYQGVSPNKKMGIKGTGYDQGCSLITGANAIQHLDSTALPAVRGRGPVRAKEMQGATNNRVAGTVTDQHLHKQGIPIGDVLIPHNYEEYEVKPRGTNRHVSPDRFKQMERGTGRNSRGERAVPVLVGKPRGKTGNHVMTVARIDPTTNEMYINDSLQEQPHKVTYPPVATGTGQPWLRVGPEDYNIIYTGAIMKQGTYGNDPFPAKRGGLINRETGGKTSQNFSGMNPRKQRRSD